MTRVPDQITEWLAAGLRLGFEVIAPCRVALSDGSILEATALVKVGPPKGMVVDPKWNSIEPYAAQLEADGFGYSAITITHDTNLVEVIRDWSGC